MRGSVPSLTGAARALLAGVIFLTAAQSALAEPPAPEPNIFPPWQHGANNDAVDRGVDFTVPQIDDLADFHGDLSDPKRTARRFNVAGTGPLRRLQDDSWIATQRVRKTVTSALSRD